MERQTSKPRYAARSAYKFAQVLRMELGPGCYFPAAVEYISQQYEKTQIENGNRRILHEDDRAAIQAGILSCKPVVAVNPVTVPAQATELITRLKAVI